RRLIVLVRERIMGNVDGVDSETTAYHKGRRYPVRGSNPRRKIAIVRLHESVRQAGLVGADEQVRVLLEDLLDVRLAVVLDHDLAQGEIALARALVHLFEEAEAVIAQAEVQGELLGDLPIVLDVR